MEPRLYQALVICKAMQLYLRTGMKVNRFYTSSAMRRTAEHITGQQFKTLKAAEVGLTQWLEERT